MYRYFININLEFILWFFEDCVYWDQYFVPLFFPLQIEKTVMFQTGCLNVTSQLAKLKKFQSRVILFSARFVPSIAERWRTGWAKRGPTASAWPSFCNVKLRSQENCYFFHPIFIVINIIWVAPLLCPIPTAISRSSAFSFPCIYMYLSLQYEPLLLFKRPKYFSFCFFRKFSNHWSSTHLSS